MYQRQIRYNEGKMQRPIKGKRYETIGHQRPDTCLFCGKEDCCHVEIRIDKNMTTAYCPERFKLVDLEVTIPDLGAFTLKPR